MVIASATMVLLPLRYRSRATGRCCAQGWLRCSCATAAAVQPSGTHARAVYRRDGRACRRVWRRRLQPGSCHAAQARRGWQAARQESRGARHHLLQQAGDVQRGREFHWQERQASGALAAAGGAQGGYTGESRSKPGGFPISSPAWPACARAHLHRQVRLGDVSSCVAIELQIVCRVVATRICISDRPLTESARVCC